MTEYRRRFDFSRNLQRRKFFSMKALLLCGFGVTLLSVAFATNLPKIENIEDGLQEVDQTRLIDYPNEQVDAPSEKRNDDDESPNAHEQEEQALEDSLPNKGHVLFDKGKKEIHRCSLPLGMENRQIRDSAITASSYAALPGYRASRSRLNTVSIGAAGYGAWVGATNDGKQWLQIDLSEVARVTRVATQGRSDADQWTKTYSLSYSFDGIHWAFYKINSFVKVFTGNTDRNNIVSHNVTPYIEARYVRFNVLTAQSHPALRVELYGCRTVHSCAEAVGIEDGRIPDSSMSASSVLSSAFSAKEARLNLQRTAWMPKTQDGNQYLRIDLTKVYSVTKVTTQGRYNIDQYVRRYTITSSLDGAHWVLYKQDGYNVKTFMGNNNGNTPVSHLLNPRIEALFIQFNPVTWQSYIALRVEVHGCPSKPICRLPLGMEDGRIQNAQLTGTSSVAFDARLYGSKAFIASANNVNQYLQVDLVRVVKVTGIAMQGRPTSTQYVKTYTVSYSADGSHWVDVRDYSQVKIFSGNNDRSSVVRNEFNQPFFARFVKIHPKSWQAHIAFRTELYGCEADGLCFKPLGLEDGRLSDQHMTASSYYNAHYKPEYGRLNNVAIGSKKGSWLAKVNNPDQYLQVDLGRQHVVTKVAIQGRYEGANFVRSFTLSYSQDGSHWTYYRLGGGGIKVFGGVADQHSIRFNHLSPSITAKFVRIQPKTWQGHIAVRMELYGCHLVNTCMEPLGVEDGRISGSAMTSSTEYSAKFAAKFGRLNIKATGNNPGAWCSKTANSNEWLQIMLNQATVITKVALQGRQDHPQWVTSFKLQFSYDGVNWAEYRHESRTVIFPGNFDQHTIQSYNLHPPIYAKFLRLRPLTWHGFTCLRTEIFGCIAKGVGEIAITS